MAHKPVAGDMLPHFVLPAVGGGQVSSADFKGKKNLVIYLFDPECPPCVGFLDRLTQITALARELNAEILTIGGESAQALAVRLGDKRPPFPVLGDESGKTLGSFGTEAAALLVADRFGEIRERVDAQADSLPDLDRVLDLLSLVEMECPECGVPTWEIGR